MIKTVELTFFEEVLGTCSSDKDIHREYIASKAPDAKSVEDEVAAIGVEGVVEKSQTIFARDAQGRAICWDYQIKGLFKDACGMLKRDVTTESAKCKAFKKEIDGLIFVRPRMIPFLFDGKTGDCQRPLRVQTPQGEKTALANSETIPAGAKLVFNIDYRLPSHESLIIEWLNYGEDRGFGQWRNSGKGRFTWRDVTPEAVKAQNAQQIALYKAAGK